MQNSGGGKLWQVDKLNVIYHYFTQPNPVNIFDWLSIKIFDNSYVSGKVLASIGMVLLKFFQVMKKLNLLDSVTKWH